MARQLWEPFKPFFATSDCCHALLHFRSAVHFFYSACIVVLSRVHSVSICFSLDLIVPSWVQVCVLTGQDVALFIAACMEQRLSAFFVSNLNVWGIMWPCVLHHLWHASELLYHKGKCDGVVSPAENVYSGVIRLLTLH